MASKKVFGSMVSRIPAYSIKGSIGSPLGAAPSIQIAAAILGMNASKVLHTVNWKNPDPECAYSLSESSRFIKHENVLVNAHGVGNVNSSILISK
jgi:nodulation protein E